MPTLNVPSAVGPLTLEEQDGAIVRLGWGDTPDDLPDGTPTPLLAEAARQIRLRNISGLIVIDFIHMENEGNWTGIIEILDNVTGRDRNPTRVLGVTEAGLVEITRRRRREPLLHTMTEICKACGGVGRIKSLDAVSIEILRLLKREARVVPSGEMVLYAANDVVMSLENDYGELVDGVEDETGRTIHLRADREYVRENYDIVVEQTGEQAGAKSEEQTGS